MISTGVSTNVVIVQYIEQITAQELWNKQFVF